MTRSRRGKGAVMPQERGPGLSLAEWLVLCLVGERPVHGLRSRACWPKTAAWAVSGMCARWWSTAPRTGWSSSA